MSVYRDDGYQEGMITGIAFVGLSSAYDTVNHRLLKHIFYNTTVVASSRTCCQIEESMWS